MAVLFRDVRVFSHELPAGATDPTHVLVEGRMIRAIGEDAVALAAADAEIIEGKGDLMIPGLINAHFHSPVNHMKGMLPSLPLEIFMLYESPDLEQLRPSPREAYVRTMLAALESARTAGWTVDLASPTRDGLVSAEAVADLLTPQTALVSVMLANNETGVVQPIEAIGERVRARCRRAPSRSRRRCRNSPRPRSRRRNRCVSRRRRSTI